MTHWTEPYIGRPYALGDADCARLVADVRREVFRQPVPPDADVVRAASRGTRNEQIKAGVEHLAERTDTPAEGDVVLMFCRARPSHVGVYCVVNNEPCVLHALENAAMVTLHRLRDLPRIALTVEGFYRWK